MQRGAQERESSFKETRVSDTPRLTGDEKEKLPLPEITMLNNDSAAFLPEGTAASTPVDNDLITEKEGDANYNEAGGALLFEHCIRPTLFVVY